MAGYWVSTLRLSVPAVLSVSITLCPRPHISENLEKVSEPLRQGQPHLNIINQY